MITINLENKVQDLVNEQIVFTEQFQEEGVFGEQQIKCWFEYRDDKAYPFELTIKVGRNWSDEKDSIPKINIDFSTMMVKEHQFFSFGNDILEDEKRKKTLQDFYFSFEALVLAELEGKMIFNYDRESYMELFEGYKWMKEQKAITSSGHFDIVPECTFTFSEFWQSEQDYKRATILAEVEEAKRYIRYFLNQNQCREDVEVFLQMILAKNKPVRIIKETSFWNYTFVVRPDMVTYDWKTLSKLGQNIQFCSQDHEEKCAAMEHVFDLFSQHAVINLCLDGVTLKELNEESDKFEDDPAAMIMHVASKLEEMMTNIHENPEKKAYQQYEEKYAKFLDGLLDLYIKYEGLYQELNNEKYKKRAQKAKRLWFKYNN